MGNPVYLNVTDLHVNSILTLGLGKTTYTVFDVCVTDPPWPSGGVPVSVALFSITVAVLSASVISCVHV